MKQLFIDKPDKDTSLVSVAGDTFHYLTNVRRMSVGDSLDCIDEDGVLYQGEILDLLNNQCTLKLRQKQGSQTKECSFVLFQCLLKGKKLDTVIRQATEAGMEKIYLVQSEYTIARFTEQEWSKKKERFVKIIKEAVQQSGNKSLPQIYFIQFSEIPNYWDNQPFLIFHHEKISDQTIHKILSNPKERVALLIGPEGGISPKELDFLHKCSYSPVYLGNNVLRAETAAIYAIGAVKTIEMEKEHGQWG